MFNKNIEKLKMLGGLAKSLAVLCFLLAWVATMLSGASNMARADELPSGDEVTDFGVGVSLAEPELNIGVRGLGLTTGTQTVSIATGFHLGYRLSVESLTGYGDNGSAMLGQLGGLITGVPNASSQDALAPDTWGLRLAGDSGWLGVVNSAPREIMREAGDYPTSRDVAVEFGVNSQALRADAYTIKLRYSVTPIAPTSPAILTATSRQKIDSGDKISLNGVNLNQATIGVDRDGDGKLTLDWDNPTRNEGCQKMSGEGIINDDNHLTCNPPLPPDSAKNDGMATAKILMRWKDKGGQQHTADTGKTLTYYYQPTLAGTTYSGREYDVGSTSPNFTTWQDLDIRQVATAGETSELLNADGAIFQLGREVNFMGHLNGITTADSNETNVIEFTRALNGDGRIGDIVGGLGDGDAGKNDSFIAVSADGKKLYGWGSNKDNRLMVGSGGYFEAPREIGSHRQAIGSWTRQVAMGWNFFVLLGKGADRPSNSSSDADRLGLYSWGVDDKNQLGDDSTKDEWPSDAPVAASYSDGKIDNDSYFVKIASGDAHSIALTNSGEVLTWGYNGANSSGEYGDGRLGWHTASNAGHIHNISRGVIDNSRDYIPSQESGYVVKDVAAGSNFSATLGADGRLYVFGGGFSVDAASKFSDSIVGMSARSDVLLAWDRAGVLHRYNLLHDNLDTKIATNVKRAFAGDIYSYYVATDGRVWRMRNADVKGSSYAGAIDITNQLKYPTYNVRLKGKNLQYSNVAVWLDRNGNEVTDDDEKLSVVHAADVDEYRTVETKISTKALTPGSYKLCVQSPYSDVDCSLTVAISQVTTKDNTVTRRSEGKRTASRAKANRLPYDEPLEARASDDKEQSQDQRELPLTAGLEDASRAPESVDGGAKSAADIKPGAKAESTRATETAKPTEKSQANNPASDNNQALDDKASSCLDKLMAAELIEQPQSTAMSELDKEKKVASLAGDSTKLDKPNEPFDMTSDKIDSGAGHSADNDDKADADASESEALEQCTTELLNRKIIEPVPDQPNLYQISMLYNSYYERRRN